MRRRDLIRLLSGAALVAPFVAHAQQVKVHRIGALVLNDDDGRVFSRELREGLRELGLSEGRNYSIELRSAEQNADRLSALAAELVQAKVDVIAAVFTPCAIAAKGATREIPIVLVSVGDPIGTGLVTSLARPRGNITGLSNMGAETAGKLVELLRDMLPSLRRIAVLAHQNDAFTKSLREQVQSAGRNAGIEMVPHGLIAGAQELEAAFAAMASEHTDAVVVASIFFSKPAADLAIGHRLPSAAILRSFAIAGGLMSYGADIPHLFRSSANFVHKILQGTKPADLPVEQPTKFELVVNLKTAKAIDLTISDSFLLRADEVIE
jgi:putative ABC transport system substrate-binding protein